MNEVFTINLGRQVFMIAADAKHDLHDYLESIKKLVSDKSVVDEVEIRMAELLTEKGVGPKAVVLKNDVEFLKQQLGSPTEFQDDADDDSAASVNSSSSRRLFRDTDHAIIAGVASGLASYFGLDVLLVRILFVVLFVATAGWGILLYALLWILVPEARTASDRLQMAGMPVTVEELKRASQNMDFAGAAKWANASLAGPINRIFGICLKLAGIGMVAFGLFVIFGLVGGLVYYLVNRDIWAQYNFFPIGISQHVLAYVAASVVALAGIFIILFGVGIVRRRWPAPVWATGILLGMLMLGVAVSGGLVASVYPQVRDSYYANTYQTTRQLTPFDTVNYSGDNLWDMNVNFAYADTYYVTLDAYGHPDLTALKTAVKGNTLLINTGAFSQKRTCPVLCVPDVYNVSLTIHAPNFNQLQSQLQNELSPSPRSPEVTPVPEPVAPPLLSR